MDFMFLTAGSRETVTKTVGLNMRVQLKRLRNCGIGERLNYIMALLLFFGIRCGV